MTAAWRTAPRPLLLLALAVIAVLVNVPGTVEAQTPTNATGRPVVLVSAEGGGILAADTSRIADADGLPYTGVPSSGTVRFSFTYQWIRVDGQSETNIGADSQRYQLVDADYGKRIKVRVSFTDRGANPEVVTSVPFGPLVRPAPLPSPSTLVGNTGQSPSASATITGTYAMRFKLGTHGQGYEISSVEIDLAAAPSSLSVSLWTGGPPGTSSAGTRRAKLFDFENPAAFQVGLNEFPAPAGAFAHQNVDYWIVLSGFGSSLSITETTSDAEDAGGEPGASLSNTARSGASSVLRLAVEGSKRTSGILAANFAQPAGEDQEIISLGDRVGWAIDLGSAVRYLIRGVTFSFDDTTSSDGGFDNPWWLRSDSLSGDRQFKLVHTRDVIGLPVWTAPQGATVAGSKTYVFDWIDLNETKPGGIDRLGAILTRALLVTDDADGQADRPTAPGVSLVPGRRLSGVDNAGNTVLMAVYGVPLDALVQNLGQTDNSYVSAGAGNTVVSQGFTTGSNVDGYPLTGIGVNIEGSGAQIPDNAASVSVSVHADSSGKPGAKLFDLLSPTEYAAGLSFFEAPRGTVLDPSTSYVLVWTYNSGAGHRLRRTSSNGEDSGKLDGFSIADAYYLGADVDNLTVDSGGNSLEIAVYTLEGALANASGRPVVLMSAEGPGILAADTWRIADVDGLPYIGRPDSGIDGYVFAYEWVRVDSVTGVETQVGGDSQRYQIVEADFGHLIKVDVSFVDQKGTPERVTSPPFGPIAEPGPPLSYPTTLVGNTAQTPSAAANISATYAMGFELGSHGQGYEISSVMIDLAAIPTDLTVSLWTGGPLGSSNADSRVTKLFEFTNPSSFGVGLNEFTAPAGLFAYQNVPYWIVLSDFGGSLSIRETTSNAQDSGGESGATLADSAGGNSSVLRLAIEGSRRTSGILAANFAQPHEGAQEIISIGDIVGYAFDLGPAERYLLRGVTFNSDDTTLHGPGFINPFWLCSNGRCPKPNADNYDDVHQFNLVATRPISGRVVWTAPQGATVVGSKTYVFDWADINIKKQDDVDRVGGVLTRIYLVTNDGDGNTALMAIMGEPLAAMVQNLGRTDNGHVSLGGASAKVLSQGFTTGSDGFGYRLQGIGFELSSDSHLPDDSGSVSVSVHADLGGQPGAKLFDLLSPTDYAAGFSFFEAPPRTYLRPSTSYVLVWAHNAGGGQRLRRTAVDGEDAGARAGAAIANAYSVGADLADLSVDSGGNALEIAVYAEVLDTSPGELVLFTPPTALVSNIGQTSTASGATVTSQEPVAQEFRTGPDGVEILESIDVKVRTPPSSSSDISAAVYTEASGVPGTKLYDLINPSTILSGAQKFTAPGGAALEGNRDYFVVFSTSSAVMTLETTSSENEDAGGAAGWSVADRRRYLTVSIWLSPADAHQIRVNGRFTVQPTEVEPGWALAPDALVKEGGHFRLLFMTSTETAATSTDIGTYNTFVQDRAAAGHEAIQEYSAGFRAVVSTASIDAVSNTATTGSRVPIYWLDGSRVADNYRDFYDGTWDDEKNPVDEWGNFYAGLGSPQAVWTGSNDSGVEHFHSGASRALGAALAERGGINDPDRGVATPNPLYGNQSSANTDTFPLYAISEVFTVDPNPAVIERLAITSNPRSEGSYRAGEEIEVTATFGAPVEVQGEPRIQLHLGQSEASQVWAEYVSGGAIAEPPVLVLVRNNKLGIPIAIDELDSTTTKAAQAFTTGTYSDGYRLESIGAALHFDDDATAGQQLTGTLNAQAENGDPGAALCTLTDPRPSANIQVAHAYTFAAPTANPCPALAANTTYFLVIERNIVTADSIRWSVLAGGISPTTIDAEILQGEPGWLIPHTRYTFASGSWSKPPSIANRFPPYGIEVVGAETQPGLLSVSNTGQTFLVTNDFSATNTKLAQGFTTGAHAAGYVLGSIGIAFQNIFDTATAGDVLTITLHETANAVPGDALCTLDDPASFTRSAVNTFAAPPNCPTLSPNTTYFVVITRELFVATEHISLATTSSDAEDAGGAAGWSLSNEGKLFGTIEASSSWGDTLTHQIEVNGVAAVAGYSPDQLVFSYTVRAGDESDSDGVQIGVLGAANAIDPRLGSITLAGTALDAVLDFGPTDIFRGHRVNWERPSLVDAVSSADGRRLHLTFSEALNPRSAPSNSYFTVMVDGEPAPLRGKTAAVAARVVTLRLLTPIASARHVLRVAYRDSPGDDADAVEDREGNDANGFRARVVPNRYGIKAELLPDSPLVPEGLEVGDQFRLLFLTSTTRDAISSNIETYNAFVQAAAGMGRRDIRAYRTGFLAVASTGDTDARDNTSTTGTGVPIYWLRGNKLADNYADFYDGSWDDEANVSDESGAAYTGLGSPQAVWTGSNDSGVEHQESGNSRALGASLAERGGINDPDRGVATPNPLYGNNASANTDSFPLYALSEVFTVVSPAAVSSVEISSDPGSDGNYATGDEIAVAFTFGDEVDVRGNPRIRIRLGDDASTERTAVFDRAVLVKNTAQTPFSGSPLNAATPKFAQRFSTGAIPGGYRLREIGIRFHTIDDPASADGQLTVTVNRDNNGQPGSAHCTLTNPASLRSNVLSNFDATACGTLPVETDYYVVIERTTVSDDTIAVWTTASDDEDASRLEDWSIGDGGHVYRTSRGSWTASGAPFVIKVGGDLTDPDIYHPRVLLSNTGQTVKHEFSPIESQARFAALFTTGRSYLGYRLRSIGFRMGAITDTSTVGHNVRVTLNSYMSLPGYELCTLSPPDSFSENAVNRFGASSCPALAPNTRYFVHFERVNFDASENIEFSTTASLSNDAAASGWSFVHQTYSFGGLQRVAIGWHQTEVNTAYRVEISGRALLPAEQPEPPDPPAQPRKQVANTGQTGLVSTGLTSSLTKHAQASTTGAHDSGYWLDSVRVRFSAVANFVIARSEILVHLHKGGGADPGTQLCTMFTSISLPENTVTSFPYLGHCPALTPNTTYFVVVERETFNHGTIETSAYTSDNEDAARPGWSIADDSRVYDGTNWSSGGGASLAIDVRAVDLPSEEDLRPSGAVEELVAGPVGKLVGSHLGILENFFILETELDQIAQSFTTGANADGYRLSSLGWLTYNTGNLASFKNAVTVSLKTSDGGNPGDTLCRLGDVQLFIIASEPMWRFYPPSANACPALEPNTTYFGVMADVPGDAITAWLVNSTSGAEDEDSEPGWSIADILHFVRAGETQWKDTAVDQEAKAWAFQVRGSALALPPSVKNFGQDVDNLTAADFAGTKVGQAFTTGAHERGYALSSIGMDISNWGEASQLAVTLNADNNGVPGEALCTLNSPADFSTPQTLDAPRSCPTLTSQTTYFAVAELLVPGSEPPLAFPYTASDAEDSDSAPDWSIADGSALFNRVQWSRQSTLVYYIEVKAVPLQMSLQVPSTPVVFSYTVAPSDESSPDGVAVGDPDSDGNTIALGGGTITIRRSGETFPLDFTALFADAGHLVNWARPTLVSAATSKDGKRVRLTFSEDLGRSGRPPTSLFTLKVDGAEAALTGIGIDAAVVDSETWTVDAPLAAPRAGRSPRPG